jgi:hypothetical protein
MQGPLGKYCCTIGSRLSSNTLTYPAASTVPSRRTKSWNPNADIHPQAIIAWPPPGTEGMTSLGFNPRVGLVHLSLWVCSGLAVMMVSSEKITCFQPSTVIFDVRWQTPAFFSCERGSSAVFQPCA